MNKKRSMKSSPNCLMRYRRASRNNVKGIFIVKVLNDEEYMTDIEQLKKKLAKIENDFYSSNLKLERIEKRRNSKIILSKVVNMFSSNKKEIKL